MAKRFTSTEIWAEDWFLEMPNEYKLFWYYMLSHCDHAGIFKVNVRSFSGLSGVSMSSASALIHFNNDKQRVREISSSVWLIEDFFVYQYGANFNLNNQLHESIDKIYKKHGIDKTTVRGLREVKPTLKDKDKVKDKEEVVIDHNLLHNTDEDFSNLNDAGLLIPEMQRAFKKHIQSYTPSKNLDFKPLCGIAKFISGDMLHLPGDVTKNQPNILSVWDLMAKWISGDPFYQTKPLSTISNQIQEISQKYKNGHAKSNTSARNGQANARQRLFEKGQTAYNASGSGGKDAN